MKRLHNDLINVLRRPVEITGEKQTPFGYEIPQCTGLQAARSRHLDFYFSANIIIRVLAGEPLSGVILESERILSCPQCTHCALRVIQGRKAYLTEAE